MSWVQYRTIQRRRTDIKEQAEAESKHWSATQKIRQSIREIIGIVRKYNKQFVTVQVKQIRLNRRVSRCFQSGSSQGGINQTKNLQVKV